MSRYVKSFFVLCFIFSIFCSSLHYARKEQKRVSGMHDVSKVEFNERAFNEGRKVLSRRLVEKAVKYLAKNDFGQSMHAFSHSKDFIDGEIYLFAYGYDGTCLAHGEDAHYIWKNMMGYKDSFGTLVIKTMIEKAKRGGGWIGYQRRNATKVAYIKPVQKGDEKFLIGAGFYPISKRDAVVSLVKGAVDNFNTELKAGETPRSAFSEFSYPLGRFVIGDLYIFAMNFDGKMVAQGDRPGLIGTNALNYKDEKGTFINREIIEKLKIKGNGVWVEYISKGAPKETYAEQVTDKQGNKYFIACGYYPETNRKKAVDLVKRGYTYMEKNGIKAASRAFSERGKKGFRFGDLWLFVFDYKGTCVAHGANRDYIGSNRYDAKDQEGRFFVREFIKTAKGGGGWVDYKVRNSYRFVYVEEVDVGAVKYVIGCGLFPISKPESMQLMVKGAAGYLRDVDREKAFEAFVKREGKFVKGDIEIFTFDFSGLCYAYGSDHGMIWKQMLNAKDDDGRPFVKLFINTAKQGAGTVVYKERKRLKTAYITRVDKEGKSYAVGSSFFAK
ncbi:cache domain-containing protein [Candidatus Dependentiae bacterium]